MIAQEPRPRGLVSLVGAGPGDPELLTLRALKRLRTCDAVVHDRLISPELLDYCHPGAARYDVGKIPGHHGRGRQEEINKLLARLGSEGQRVVRLKGGDPFVFGRGGEEALALSEAGVPFEVVPGVSSTLAAPAAAGIPVTHRGLATSVTVATGHARADGSEDESHDWGALARMRGTLVFLMAIENLDRIAARRWHCTRTGCVGGGRPTCSSPPGRGRTATGACARCSSAMPRRPVCHAPSRRTGYGTSS